MNNPINNQVFDTRDLIEYKLFLEAELVDNWNSFEGTENHQATDITEVLTTTGYEYADDIKEVFEAFEDTYILEIEEYKKVDKFCEELSSYSSDFEHGNQLYMRTTLQNTQRNY